MADTHRLDVRSQTIEAELGRVRDEVARLLDRLTEVETENRVRRSELDALQSPVINDEPHLKEETTRLRDDNFRLHQAVDEANRERKNAAERLGLLAAGPQTLEGMLAELSRVEQRAEVLRRENLELRAEIGAVCIDHAAVEKQESIERICHEQAERDFQEA